VSDQKATNNWLLVSCSKEGQVTLAGTGAGGFAELKAAFDQSGVMFGVLKVLGKDVRNNVESIRQKFIFLSFIGKDVPVMQRARVSVQRDQVEKLFQGLTMRIDISGGDIDHTFTRESIRDELLRSGGAHKPTHYVFGPGDEMQL